MGFWSPKPKKHVTTRNEVVEKTYRAIKAAESMAISAEDLREVGRLWLDFVVELSGKDEKEDKDGKGESLLPGE